LLTGGALQRKLYGDVFTKWPRQELRPDYQLQDVVRKAVEQRLEKATPAVESEEVIKARALQMLLQNRFRDKVRPSCHDLRFSSSRK
jgi:cytochrome b pre-mRNA-processing protein 6